MKASFNPVLLINKSLVFERMRVNASSNIYKKVNELFEGLVPLIEKSVDYQAVFTVEDNHFGFVQSPLSDCDKIVFCYVTIGERVCHEVNRMFEDGRLLEGYLLNEMTNEVVMDATNQLYGHIKGLLKPIGFNLSKRLSPGECTLDMTYQSLIMNELKKSFDIKGTLTSAYMINPEKSTLYLYGADPDQPDTDMDFDCGTCPSHSCPYRRSKPL
ncbi:MAG: Uncharacterized protein XD91_1681 [Clostridiales bacterium 38_11]|nr:MAG: Uncharacterized protein XD91_1681 [Clostridiales bacterium 38_11]HBH12648.1 hypothetical protein [Clostridiales bacterium]